jgi:cell wall assembly regulator SMI1
MKRWIPFTRDMMGLGSALFIDPCPSLTGIEGQIIFCDATRVFVVASSFDEICQRLTEGLRVSWTELINLRVILP